MSVGADLRHSCVVGLVTMLAAIATVEAGDRPLSFEDLMKFRQIRDASISDDGGWVAYALVPDRGDGEAVVRSTSTGKVFRIERGSKPVISADGLWVAAAIVPTLEERDKAEATRAKKASGKDDDTPKSGLSLLDLGTGSEERIEKVESFAFSDDGRWLAFRLCEEKKKPDEASEEGSEEGKEKKEKKPKLGTTMRLRDLSTGEEITVEHVIDFVFAERAPILAFAVSAPEGEGNGIRLPTLL